MTDETILRPHQTMAARIVLIVIITLVLVTAFNGLLLGLVRDSEGTVHWINVAGSQRAQSVTLLDTLRKVQDLPPGTREAELVEAAEIVDAIRTDITDLLAGSESRGLRKPKDPDAIAELTEAERLLREEYLPAVRAAEAAMGAIEFDRLDRAEQRFRERMNAAISIVDDVSEKRLLRTEQFLWVLLLTCFLAGLAVIFTSIFLMRREQEAAAGVERKAQVEAILNSTADAIITIDAKGIVQEFNDAAQRMLGYQPDEVIGRNVNMLMGAPHKEQHDGYLARYLRTGEARIIGSTRELEARRKDGSMLPIALRVREMSYRGRKLFIGVMSDTSVVRDFNEQMNEVISRVATAANQLLASATEQATGAQEQAASITETVTTVEEVTQSAQQASQRAKAVAESAKEALSIGRRGNISVQAAVGSMEELQSQVDVIAGNIVSLSDQTQSIGEIIDAVSDIAEQTNILALNAAIEASRAGEAGRAFSVVANEVKSLADQSKQATTRVRDILSEIQRATNSAVLSTEQGTKSVKGTVSEIREAGKTIRKLVGAVEQAAMAAGQIAAGSGQQATGVAQISAAMKNIDQVTRQNVDASRQAEEAAQSLSKLGSKLESMVRKQG